MASQESLLSDLEKNVECSICLTTLPDDPRFLPCGHSFCFSCISQIHVSDTRKRLYPEDKINCPKCRTKHTLPFGGIDDLPVDFTTKNIVELVRKNTVKERKEKPAKPAAAMIFDTSHSDSCGMCRNAGKSIPATNYCITCELLMCAECNTRHQKKPGCVNHAMVSVSGESGSEPYHCNCSAAKRLITQFCEGCVTSVCASCSGSTHAGHKLCYFVKQPNNSGASNSNVLKAIEQHHQRLKTQQIRLERDTTANRSLRDDIKREIGTHFEDLVATLTSARQRLCAQVDDYHDQVESGLAAMKPQVTGSLDSLSALLQQAEAFRRPLPCDDVTLQQPLCDKDLQTSYSQICLPAQDRLDFNVIFSPEKSLAFGELDLATLRLGTRVYNDLRTNALATITANLKWRAPHSKTPLIYGLAKYQASSLIYTGFGGTSYSVGRVNSSGQVVPIFVEAGIRESAAVILLATDPSENKIALVYEKDACDYVSLFEHEKKTVSFKCPDNDTGCIVFSADGSQLILSRSSEERKAQCFSFYNTAGNHIRTVNIHPDPEIRIPFQGYESIAVDQLGRIIVTDTTNRQIHIYNGDAERVASFPKNPDVNMSPSCACVDSQGEIFVGFSVSSHDNVISHFRADGTFVRHVVKLNDQPRSVCFPEKNRLAVGTSKKGLMMFELE